MKFPESALAHKYCIGHGLEIGAAAHNPFNLKDCLFLANKERVEFWRESEINSCGEFIKPDMYGDAENIPLENSSLDYVISSHVIEHVPNPIKAFFEWNRILKDQGIVFMIFPKRDADPNDVNRPISEISDFYKQYNNPQPLTDEHCHIWIFTLSSMVGLIDYCNKEHNLGWEIIDYEETDSKVGNGSTVVCRVKK
jgi:SAM-dependent methyltransferase